MAEKNIQLEFQPTEPGSLIGELVARNSEGQTCSHQVDLADPEARTRFAKDMIATWPDARLQVEHLEAQIDKLSSNQQGDAGETEECRPVHLSRKALRSADPALVDVAKKFLQRQDLIEELLEHFRVIGIAGEQEAALATYLVGVSRLLPKPIAAIILGTSSSGKSYVIDRVGALFPDETVLRAHRMTPRALEYKPTGSLEHCFVAAGERSRRQDDSAAEATRALREMLSEGCLRLEVVEKGPDGKHATRTVHQPGPISFIESTTLGLSQLFDEDRNRMLILQANESQQQTADVLSQIAMAAANPVNDGLKSQVTELHHTAQRLLEPLDVCVPYAPRLVGALPRDRVQVRRAFQHLLGLVKSMALLHQFQRDRDQDGRVTATIEDYDLVRKRFAGPIARSLGLELSQGSQTLWERLRCYNNHFTISDLEKDNEIALSENSIRARVSELTKAGMVKVLQPGAGRRPATYCIDRGAEMPNKLQLPDLHQEDEGGTRQEG